MWTNVGGFSKIGCAGFCVVFKSLASTLIRCDTPSWLWPLWLLAVDGKEPVNGLTQAREPMRF